MAFRKTGYLGFRCTGELQKRVEDLADHEHLSVGELLRQILGKAVLYREKQIERETQNTPKNESDDHGIDRTKEH